MRLLLLSEISSEENKLPEQYSEGFCDKNILNSRHNCAGDDVYYSINGCNDESLGVYYRGYCIVGGVVSNGGSLGSDRYYISGKASWCDSESSAGASDADTYDDSCRNEGESYFKNRS